MSKKITLATIKKFVKENSNNLFIKVESSFDGMTDCVQDVESEFSKVDADKVDVKIEYSFGINGAWFVRGSRDSFYEYSDAKYVGYEIANCCGSFKLVTKKGN